MRRKLRLLISKQQFTMQAIVPPHSNLITDFVFPSGHGKFQKILLGVSGMVYATCAISTTTLSFVLPSAQCDFHLSSADKGKLSAMPLIGMIFGCSLWGSVADCYGRKVAIILALIVDFLAAVISSTMYSLPLFLTCRFFSGFGIIGATSIIFSYLGEFLLVKHRDAVLGRLEIFWNVGMIVLPGVAWAFLNSAMLSLLSGNGQFASWRIFVLVCSLPSLISVVMLCFMPETPKFLISKGRYDEAKNVFRRMFASNTGRAMCFYPVSTLEGECENNNSFKFNSKTPVMFRVAEKCKKVRYLISELFSPPYLKFLGVTCFADFGLMASYYTLIMWFPEIFARFSDFELKHPNRTATICEVSQHAVKQYEKFFYVVPCDPTIGSKVFIDTIIIGLSCFPTSVSLSYLIKKIGKKSVLVTGLIMSGLATLLLNFVESPTQTLILSCIFEALTGIMETVIFCVVVDLFPTNLRAIALSTTATCGRLGAIFGNVAFGFLIDINCVIPIYLFAFLLIASAILCLAVPRNESYITLH
ncbi:hypothetical protein NQ317_019411 [Molorchus minor]|uniref:Major facilitator superfamily (MFS) profile domain-containing protein n=1 Tax=Molorchus minor TaxID=1323400 RepID=A0ABQ9JHR4_9CUCU|nr:hypothetical protein NQ317_019411 [Molorchus minor]